MSIKGANTPTTTEIMATMFNIKCLFRGESGIDGMEWWNVMMEWNFGPPVILVKHSKVRCARSGGEVVSLRRPTFLCYTQKRLGMMLC